MPELCNPDERDNREARAMAYTGEACVYNGMAPYFGHETVKHGVGECVEGAAHTNRIESFWLMFKQAQRGAFHKLSLKHLDRHVTEFDGRHNNLERDTIGIRPVFADGSIGKRLRYEELTAGARRDSGAGS